MIKLAGQRPGTTSHAQLDVHSFQVGAHAGVLKPPESPGLAEP